MSQETRPKALVTGGAGFVGSQLVRDLLRNEWTVWVYDNLSFGSRENLPDDPRLKFIKADILDLGTLKASLLELKPNAIFHLAALHYIPYCDTHKEETIRVNVEGTQSLLSVIEECKLVTSRIVFPV